MNQLDHIVIAADSLDQGMAWIEDQLGVTMPMGGQHQTMGTHNRLMQLGNRAYLELIAINPDAPAPAWPRWFDLDRGLLRAAIKQQPRLITWVMNCEDLHRLHAAVDFDMGTPTALTRDQLSWEISLTDDGRLLAGGLLPYCLQWHSRPHPSEAMAELGCRLRSLTLHHNRVDWLTAKLEAMGATHLAEVKALKDNQAPYLSVDIESPKGLVTIDSIIQ